MTTLVISDMHLTDKFDERKFKFLSDLFDKYDKIIINGDFWDSYSTDFEKFIKSDWAKLFPILKSKNTVYIYGNHDIKSKSKVEKLRLFSDMQTQDFEMVCGDKKFIFMHGHDFFKKRSTYEKESGIYKKFRLNDMSLKVEKFLLGKFGSHTFDVVTRKLNRKMKKYARENLADLEYLIVGHTHYAEIDEKNKFLNSGFVRNGVAQYLVIDGEKVVLKKGRY